VQLVLAGGPVRRQPVRPIRQGSSPGADVMCQWAQSHLSSASIDPLRILQGQWAHVPLDIPVELSSVALRTPLETADPILQHRCIKGRDITPLCGRLESHQRASLKGGLSDGMLRDEPSRLGSLSTNLGLAGPTVGVENHGKSNGIGVVHGAHAWLIPLEQRSIGFELGSEPQILLRHGEELHADGRPDVGHARLLQSAGIQTNNRQQSRGPKDQASSP
jgi:hypothetical protein